MLSFPFPPPPLPPPFFFFACTDHSWTSSGATWTAFKWPLIYALRCPVEVHFFTVVATSFRWTKAGMLFKCSCVNHECPVWSFKPFFFIIPFLSRECSRLHLREHCSSSAAWWHLFLAHYLDILGLTFFFNVGRTRRGGGGHTFHNSVAHSLRNAYSSVMPVQHWASW